MKGILGRKVGMTEVFTTDGKVIPVTVVKVDPNIVTQIKTKETNGYDAVQLGVSEKKMKHANKAEQGHVKNAKTSPKRFLKEIRVSNTSDYELGSEIKADIFGQGDIVDVTGTSKGKGFAGAIKRHGYSKGPETHGSRHHRRPGSLGTIRPARVFKGTKLPGHMGHEKITIQNLTIVDVNTDLNYVLISGNIPGPKKSLVVIKEAIKNNGKKKEFELVSYEKEISKELEETADQAETNSEDAK